MKKEKTISQACDATSNNLNEIEEIINNRLNEKINKGIMLPLFIREFEDFLNDDDNSDIK